MAEIIYWRLVSRKALESTLAALGLDSAERVMLRIVASVIGVALVWGIVGATDAKRGFVSAAIAALAILLIFPIVFLIKLVTTPAKLDVELRRQLKQFTDENARQAERQAAIDDLAEEIDWATKHLVNPNPHPLAAGSPHDAISKWRSECENWYVSVSEKLGNRKFFTRAQQLHFDVLTRVDQVVQIGNMEFGHPYNILHMKIGRLRDIIAEVAASNRGLHQVL
jgi:hypothetical protein